MAHADGSIDKDELQALFAVVDFEGLSDDAQRTVCSYLVDPPALAGTLIPLRKAEEVLRFSLMVNLVEIAYANDVVTPEERHVLAEAGRVLCITVLADTVKAAQQHANQMAHGIHFDGAQYRRDIGHRAVRG